MNKIRIICSSVVLALIFAVLGFADEHFPFLAEVSRESVNVRAGPNTNFEKVDKLNKGAQVVVLGHYYEWYKAQPLPTTKSFIRSDYLKIDQPTHIAEVSGNNVNVRTRPSSDSASLGEVKKGTLVRVTGSVDGWSALAPVAGTVVWIHQDFLKEVSPNVPASMFIAPVPKPSETLVSSTVTRTITEKVSLQGKLKPVSSSVPSVHYEIVIDNQSTYFLQDIPKMDFFADAVVTVEGTVVPDPDKKLMFPLLHINKISLVL